MFHSIQRQCTRMPASLLCRFSHSNVSKRTHKIAHSKKPFGKFSLDESVHLKVGDFGEYTKTFQMKDVQKFAELTGDDNPVHTNENLAKKSRFQQPVVHGALVSSLIGTVFGSHIPGAIYVDQHIKYKKPTFVGDEVTATCTVTSIHKKFVTCDTVCRVGEEEVVSGAATVLIDHLHIDHHH